jgi:hypothetical protein
MLLSDCYIDSRPKHMWGKLKAKAHGVLLRQLGKVRVIYLIRQKAEDESLPSMWHSDINLVTGVSKVWLRDNFRLEEAPAECVLA